VVVETIAGLEELLTNRGAPGWSLSSAEPPAIGAKFTIREIG